MLRRRLEQLDKDFGFDPKGHSGKALRHAVGRRCRATCSSTSDWNRCATW